MLASKGKKYMAGQKKVIDPEFEALPEVKHYRDTVKHIGSMMNIIRYVALIMGIIVIIAILADNDILRIIVLAVDVPALILTITLDIHYRKEYKTFSDILDNFYAKKLGTTPEALRDFDKMVDEVYGGDYDKVFEDVEYIKNHPLLFGDKDDSNGNDSKKERS